MKKIVLLHVPDTFNYGSAMMGINFIHYFSLATNMRVGYVADISTLEDLSRFQEETGKKRFIEKLKKGDVSPGGSGNLQKLLSLEKRYLNWINNLLSINPLGVVILGGDDLSEYYEGWRIAFELYKIYKLSIKIPVILFGQTIGPFYSWRKLIAHCFLRNCIIYTRGPKSAKYLKMSLRLKRVIESSDLAFLDLPNQNNVYHTKNILKKYGISENNYITFVPSGLFKKYTSSYIDYIQIQQAIVRFLAEHPDIKSKKIVLLAHVLRPAHIDDRVIIKTIKDKLFKKYADRLVCVTDTLLPSEARMILGNGLFTITGRMHAAISTFQMGKPAISLSYSIKYMDVIGEGLNLNDLIIQSSGNKLWNSFKIVDLVKNKVDYILCNYNSFIDRIGRSVEKSKRLVTSNIEELARKFEEVKNTEPSN